MSTVGDIIRSSFKKIGVLAGGEAMPADEGADALSTFQMMISAWSNETLMIPLSTVITHTLMPQYSEYTIGIYDGVLPIPDNHIETVRPQAYLSTFIRSVDGADYPVKTMTQDMWTRISRKDTVSRPSRMYIRDGYPMDTLLLSSAPYENEVLHLQIQQPLEGFIQNNALVDTLIVPSGYEQALIYNLAIELAPEYGKQVDQIVFGMAQKSKANIKRMNANIPRLRVDKGLTPSRHPNSKHYDINVSPGS
jgi:hypothetical protein